jgi:hypothetical protein
MAETKKANGSDVLTLNVGGEKTVQTFRSTLTVVPGSKLAEMFSGDWDESLPKDKNGDFFIDHEPEIFLPLLKFLRSLSAETLPEYNQIPPTTPSFVCREDESSFCRMVDAYNLTNALYCYDIYYGTDRTLMTRNLSVLDFVMTTRDGPYCPIFYLDRPNSRKVGCHGRKLQAYEALTSHDFRGSFGWFRRQRMETCCGKAMLLDVAERRFTIFHEPAGDGTELVLNHMEKINNKGFVIRCSKHVETGTFHFYVDGVLVVRTCSTAQCGNIADVTGSDSELPPVFRVGWSGAHSEGEVDMVPMIFIETGSCQFSAIELEILS